MVTHHVATPKGQVSWIGQTNRANLYKRIISDRLMLRAMIN